MTSSHTRPKTSKGTYLLTVEIFHVLMFAEVPKLFCFLLRHNDKHHPKTAESSDGLQEKAKAQRKALAKSRKRKRDLARKARASMREKGEEPVGDSPVSSEAEDSEPEPAKKKPRYVF